MVSFSSLKNLFRKRKKRGHDPPPVTTGLAALLRDNGKYIPVRILGRGSYGLVLLAKRKEDGENVAIKLLARGRKINDRVLREIKNHKLMDHPNVVKFHEYAPGKSLLDYVASKAFLQEDTAREVFQQLILAVHYCHSVRVVSRDIKLDNTLIDDSTPPRIKICDFGYSKHMDDDSVPNSQVGTLHYLAPEIYRLRADQSYDAQKADVWSCGIFLYAILTGNYPFRSIPGSQYGYYELVQRITKGEFYVPDDCISPEGCDLLTKMINIRVHERISIEDVRQHPWFKVGLPDDFENQWTYKKEQIKGLQNDHEIESMVKKAKSTSFSDLRIEEMIKEAREEPCLGHDEGNPSGRGSDRWLITA